MATSNNRDVRLTVEAQTQGEESIRKLAAQVRALGKEGQDAAPEFERLAAELDSLAGQSRAVETFKKLTSAVESAAAAQRNALIVASDIDRVYAEQAAKVDVLRASQAEAATAVKSTSDALRAARDDFAAYKANVSDATKETSAYTIALKDGRDKILQARNANLEAKDALKDIRTETNLAAKAERELAAERKSIARDVGSTTAALREQSTALRDTEAAAKAAGVNVSDLTAEEVRLSNALVSVVTGAERNRQQMLEAAAAAEQLAKATALAERAEVALNNIRKVAFQQDVVAKAKAEADATRELAAAQAQAERAQTALNNIRKVAYQQDVVAQVKAETAAQAALNVEQAQAERLQTALNNIRKAAYQQDVAAQIKAEVEAQKALNAEQAQAERIQTALNNIRKVAFQSDQAAKIRAEAEALKQLAVAAEQVATQLPNAFSQAGVRSVAAIQAEITQTTRAMAMLEAQFAAGAISAYDLQRATGAASLRVQELRAEMVKMPAAAGVFERMNDSVLGLVNRFGALTAAIATVGFAVKPVLDANLALDSMRRVLTTVYGSAEEAAKQIDFVRRVSESAGINVLTAGEAFTRFAASARASGINSALVQRVFEATANAAGNLGLSSDKTAHILDALGQMANKGTVSMEELRQQLGDSLPGALSLLAKGLGITEPQLVKLVESGKLLTSEALGPLADAMTTLAAPGGRVEGLRASMERLGNQFKLAYQSISDTSFYRGLITVTGSLANNFNTVTTAVKLMVEALVVSKVATAVGNFLSLRAATAEVVVVTEVATVATVAHTAATGANTVATGANTVAKVANAAASVGVNTAATLATSAISTIGGKALEAAASISTLTRAKTALGGAASRLVGLLGGPQAALVTLAIAAYELGPALGRAIAGMVGFGDKTAEVTSKLRAAEKAIQDGAKARELEGDSLVRAKVLYAEQASVLSDATAASEKLAKATKDRGEAAIIAAELSGNERDKLAAVTQARRDDTVALEAVAVSKKAEADLTAGLIALAEKSIEGKGRLNTIDQQRLEMLTATRDLLGGVTEAQAKELAGLQLRAAEAEKATASTREQIKLDRQKLEGQRAAGIEAEAAALKERALADAANYAAEAAKNNAGRTEEYREKLELARATVEVMRGALERGEVTQAAYNRAVRDAGIAEGLFKDSLNDSVKAIERRTAAAREESNLRLQGIQLQKTQIEVDGHIADLTGQYTDKLNAKIAAKGLDLQASRETISAMQTTAAAMREEAALRERSLDLSDLNYEAKRREIDALNNSAKATENAAKVEQARMKGAEIELGILNGTLYQGAKGFSEFGDKVDGATRKLDNFTAAGMRAGSVLQSTQYDTDKYALNSDGSRFTAGGQLKPPDNSGDWTFVGDVRTSGSSSRTDRVNVQGQGYWQRKAAPDSYTGASTPGATSNNGTSGTSVFASQAKQQDSINANRTVNITLTGRPTASVTVASDADAAALAGFLRELENSMRAMGA